MRLAASRCFLFFFSSRRRHTRCLSDWSSDVCSSDLHQRAYPQGSAARCGRGEEEGPGQEGLTTLFVRVHMLRLFDRVFIRNGVNRGKRATKECSAGRSSSTGETGSGSEAQKRSQEEARAQRCYARRGVRGRRVTHDAND